MERDASIVNPEDRAESDDFSEGGSDSESSDDDFSVYYWDILSLNIDFIIGGRDEEIAKKFSGKIESIQGYLYQRKIRS